MRLLDGLENPVGAKFDGSKARRMVLAPEVGRLNFSVMSPNGLFNDKTVGAFGAVSAGQIGIVVRARFAVGPLRSSRIKKYIFPPADDTLALAENEIFGETPRIFISNLMVLGYPRIEKSSGHGAI